MTPTPSTTTSPDRQPGRMAFSMPLTQTLARLRAALLLWLCLCARHAPAEEAIAWCPCPQETPSPTTHEPVAAAACSDGEENRCGTAAAQSAGHCRRRRDVWSVITRGLPDIRRMPEVARPAVERLDESGCWRGADLERLLENPGQPLLVFIHGNRYDHGSAREQGLLLASRTCATCPEAANTRTVIFSWPSDKQGILLRDSRAKYERAVSEGHYLAWLLSKVEPDRPVAIVGYSYGSLIAVEALEDLVHAQWAGRDDIHPWIERPAPLHLVLVAAAVRHDAFAPRGPYRETLSCIDRLTVLYNSSDMALSFFEHVDRSLRTEALGHEGMPASWMPRGIGFGQVDAAQVVGPSHRFKKYLASPDLMRRICSGAGKGLCCPHTDCPDAGGAGHAEITPATAAASEPMAACPCSLP